MSTDTAYKILTRAEFALLEQDAFTGAPVDLADGYIHLSTATQLDETLNKHFAGQDDLVIAAIRLPLLGDDLRWEPSRGGQLFPHYYGHLKIRHISATIKLTRNEAGHALLPSPL